MTYRYNNRYISNSVSLYRAQHAAARRTHISEVELDAFFEVEELKREKSISFIHESERDLVDLLDE